MGCIYGKKIKQLQKKVKILEESGGQGGGQNYVTVQATSQTTAATDVLPASGQASDTIYRVSNWDGSANNGAGGFDVTKYSEYTWDDVSNPNKYVFLCVNTTIGEVFDISVYNNNAKYADLAAALGTNGANIPVEIRRGGMSIKFVQSNDNKYVQCRLITTSFSTNESDWLVVDDELLNRIPLSGKLYGYLENGTISDNDKRGHLCISNHRDIIYALDGYSFSVFGNNEGEGSHITLIQSSTNYIDLSSVQYKYIFLNIKKGDGLTALTEEDLMYTIYVGDVYNCIQNYNDDYVKLTSRKGYIVNVPTLSYTNAIKSKLDSSIKTEFIPITKNNEYLQSSLIITFQGLKWQVVVGYNSYIIPLPKGTSRSLHIKANSSYYARFAFLRTNAHVANTTPDFCIEYPYVIQVDAGQIQDVAIPNDCAYLYVLGNDRSNNDYYPEESSIVVYTIATESDDINIENKYVKAYLDTKYDRSDYTYTKITDYVTIAQNERKDYSIGKDLSWTNNTEATGVKIVYSTNNSFGNSVVIELTTDIERYSLCNLKPNKHYWVKVVNTVGGSDIVVYANDFDTIGRRRLINLQGGFNCRDMGGLKTIDNLTIRYGLCFRGGELDGQASLTTTDHATLENIIGIKDDFDFRTEGGTTTSPLSGVTRHGIALYSMVGVYDRDNPSLDQTMLGNYKVVLEALLSCLANKRPVYMHCQGGCDRTNTMVWLINGVLGVSENDLVLDYELSSFAQGAPNAYNSTGGMIRSREPLANTYHDNYHNAIEYIKTLQGNTLRDKFEYFWINELNVTQSQLNQLREYMLC